MPVEMLAGGAQPRLLAPSVPQQTPSPRGREVASGRRGRLVRSSPFLLPLAVYLVVGAVLAFHYASFQGDGQNRVADAYYVLFSRDPHLAAIGFVWNPLPTLAVLPLLPFKFLWPTLTERAYAGDIVSALFMAGAVYQLQAMLADLGVRLLPRAALTALFAAHPMIVYYAANGMSEAPFLFALVLTSRYLVRWLDDGDLVALMISGMGLALAYLTRIEALAAALFATAVVLVVASTRQRPARWTSGLAHAGVFVAPCAATFAALSAISWVIVGDPLQQLSSVYGTASQLRVLQAAGSNALTKPAGAFALQQVTSLAPLLVVAAGVGLAAAVRRRDVRILAALATIGGVLVFAVAAFIAGKTIGSTRYFITAVPLTVVLAGTALASPRPNGAASHRGGSRGRPAVLNALVALLVVAVAAPGIVTAERAMLDPKVDPEDSGHLSYVVRSGAAVTDAARADSHRYDRTRAIAHYLDGLRLPDGSIVVDTFDTCVPYVVLASKRPKQFVITNDRDFGRVLADPAIFHARYLMPPPPGGYGDLDALNRTYPSLYEDGAGMATLAHEFTGAGCPAFRLYRVDRSPPPGA